MASPSASVPAPAPTVSEADQEPGPARRPTAVLAGPGGKGDGEPDSEPALDRPGAPVLAGAAIAGALLVVAPFAVSAGMPAVSLSTVTPQSPVTSALGDQSGDGSAQVDGNAASVADVGGGSPVTENAADPGFVPQVQEGSTSPSLPDPGPASEGTDAVETSAPAGQEGSPENTGPEGTTIENGSPETTGGTETAAGEASESGTVTDSPQGTPEETVAGETETTSDGEDGPASAENDATDAGTSSEAQADDPGTGAGGEEAPAQPPLDGTDPPESASILENATETIVPVEERYRALTGPGCAGTTDSSYGGEGRWQSAEDSAGWTTRPGGYDQEGCEGSYEAIPVSGDPEKGDHQYAEWTFTPGEEGAACEIYVHVPEDESPLWVAAGEARYRIHPGNDTTESAVAVFGIEQAEVSGGWVQVTGFVSPEDAFTVRLTNAGEDPFPDDEHTNAHVAASAMRADCS